MKQGGAWQAEENLQGKEADSPGMRFSGLDSSQPKRPRLVILGTGFGAFSLLQAAKNHLADIAVVSPRNHFLFTPLLASTTVGSLEFRSVIESVRMATQGRFFLAEAMKLDTVNRRLLCRAANLENFDLDSLTPAESEFEIEYDGLVIAVGAANHTFGIPGVAKHALFLKQVRDARRIRQRIFACLERAALPGISQAERDRLLHFVIVGGGPTGVEFAAELHDLWQSELKRAYPTLVASMRITLVDAGKQLLSSYDASLSAYTERHFRRQSIEVRQQATVVAVDAESISLKGGDKLPYGCLVWATGNAPTAFVAGLNLPKDNHGRLLIDRHLRVTGTEGVYALGDCSAFATEPLAATAQAAEQQGEYLASALVARFKGMEPPPFRYRHQGMLAYVGGHSGIADLSRFKGRGFAAFLFWRLVYLTKLVSLRNKVMVVFDWARTLLFGREISRM